MFENVNDSANFDDVIKVRVHGVKFSWRLS